MKNIEDLENVNELFTLQNQFKTLRLQGKLGSKIFLQLRKKVCELLFNTIKDTS